MTYDEWWIAISKTLQIPPILDMALANYDKDPVKSVVYLQETLKNYKQKPLTIYSSAILSRLYCDHGLFEQSLGILDDLSHTIAIDAYAETDTPAVPAHIDFLRGRTLEGLKENLKAIYYYGRAADYYKQANLTDMVQKCLLHKATLENGLGRYKEAKESFDTILKIGMDNHNDYNLIGSALLQRIEIALLDGDYGTAKQLFSEVSKIIENVKGTDLRKKLDGLKSKL